MIVAINTVTQINDGTSVQINNCVHMRDYARQIYICAGLAHLGTIALDFVLQPLLSNG